MCEHINLITYQDHETESNFPDDKSVVDYYKEKISTCNVLIDFIKSNFVNDNWRGNFRFSKFIRRLSELY